MEIDSPQVRGGRRPNRRSRPIGEVAIALDESLGTNVRNQGGRRDPGRPRRRSSSNPVPRCLMPIASSAGPGLRPQEGKPATVA